MADDKDEAYFYGAPGAFSSRPRVSGVVETNAAAASDALGALPPEVQQLIGALAAASMQQRPTWSKVAAAPPSAQAAATAASLSDPAFGASAATSAPARAPTGRPPPASQGGRGATPCAYFLSGSCRFGDACRYSHATASSGAVAFFESEIARLRREAEVDAEARPALAGATSASAAPAPGAPASAGSDAAFEAESEAWQAAALAQKQALLQRAVDSGVAAGLEEAETALHHAERNASRDVACGICFENITEVPGRRFGLLTGCTHPFCLDCIREWRARIDLPNDTVRACPLCRKTSYFVVPCDRYIADAARKADVNAAYHASQKGIPCRLFNMGKGTCPFGSSCFYLHLNADGTPYVEPKHTIRLDADGNVGVGRAYKLNEFLDG
jgi:hypothetical protein